MRPLHNDHENIPKAMSEDGLISFREQTLQRTLRYASRLRRRREFNRRAALLMLPLVLLVGGLLLFRPPHWFQKPQSPQLAHGLHVADPLGSPRTIPGTDIRILSDEDLFALLKGRPIALVGPPGHQRLILLDEINAHDPDSNRRNQE